MEVFFLRHGETDGNVAKRHQHTETPLNEIGKAQAAVVAEKIAELAPTHIVSSTHLRAMETTRIVAAACGITPETHHAFEELDRPAWLVGHRYLGLTTLSYVVRWFLGRPIEAGESYEQFRLRLIEARTYLESLPADARVVVVSHSVFINVFLEHLCISGRMNFFRACLSFLRIFLLRNTSLVHVSYSKGEKVCGWLVRNRAVH